MNRRSRILFGAIGPTQKAKVKGRSTLLFSSSDLQNLSCLETDLLIVYFRDPTNGTGNQNYWISTEKTAGIFWFGEIFDCPEFKNRQTIEEMAQSLCQSYLRHGPDFLKHINGAYVLIAWGNANKSIILARDQIGIESLYVYQNEDGVVFGSKTDLLTNFMGEKKIDSSAFLKYLTFCYNPGEQTFFQGIRRIRPAHCLIWQDSKINIRPYWYLDFDNQHNTSEREIGNQIKGHLQSAVKIRLKHPEKTGAFLSGGLDSSSIVSLLRQGNSSPISTFSFRCQGESFDESHYAQMVSEACHTKHLLVDYQPEDVLKINEMVSLMDEPFCDVGINIATYLLAQSANGSVKDLFTGDGGDELFGGHPVYIADRTAALFRWIPWPFRQLILYWGRTLSDSEKKKNWKVKMKRFSESYQFPESLGTHRWRAYYTQTELKKLMNSEYGSFQSTNSIFNDIIQCNQNCSHNDSLNQSLCCDYQTVVQFYLRRMDMVRAFGMIPKFPMLDPNIVAYCARIPSSLKIHGMSDAKYIERIAVEPLLPYAVVHRKDKLGHSIPLKNWMRHHPRVKSFMLDVLSETQIKKRGYFNANQVHQMIQEHLSSQRNHSHRLWALMVFELWMEKHINV